jgi:hypothetical protein
MVLSLIGIPIVEERKIFKLKVFLNTQLDQHPHKSIPEIPNWVFSEYDLSKEMKDESVECVVIFLIEEQNKNLGLLLLIIDASGMGYFLGDRGDCYFVGQTKCESYNGCVLLVNFSRGPSNFILGGTVTIIDVLAFDGINYTKKDLREKNEFFKYLPDVLRLPSRYKVKGGTFLNSKDAMTFLIQTNKSSNYYALLK